MRQTFGVRFLHMSPEHSRVLTQYVAACIRLSSQGKRPPAQTIEDERRRFHRITPLPSDDVRMKVLFKAGKNPIAVELVNISAGGAQCRCEDDFIVKPGAEIVQVWLSLPDGTIQCRGQVVYAYGEPV